MPAPVAEARVKVTDRTVALVLRFFGVIDLTSVATAAMPFPWMRDLNARLGFGTLPDTPTVEYLARQTSLWYAAHAAVWIYLSTDVPLFRPAVRFVGRLGLAFAAGLAAINLVSGLPLWWAVAQLAGGSLGPATLLICLRLSEPAPDSPLLGERGRG